MALHDVTEIFADSMVLVDGARRVELIWAPSEVDDALAVWLPDDGLLFGGAATPGSVIPNIGTPLRTQRFTIRWAETLERLAALGATRLVTEFGPMLEGEAIDQELVSTAEALRWLHAEVVVRMNAGMSEREILADMTYPPELFDVPWMQPNSVEPGPNRSRRSSRDRATAPVPIFSTGDIRAGRRCDDLVDGVRRGSDRATRRAARHVVRQSRSGAYAWLDPPKSCWPPMAAAA